MTEDDRQNKIFDDSEIRGSAIPWVLAFLVAILLGLAVWFYANETEKESTLQLTRYLQSMRETLQMRAIEFRKEKMLVLEEREYIEAARLLLSLQEQNEGGSSADLKADLVDELDRECHALDCLTYLVIDKKKNSFIQKQSGSELDTSEISKLIFWDKALKGETTSSVFRIDIDGLTGEKGFEKQNPFPVMVMAIPLLEKSEVSGVLGFLIDARRALKSISPDFIKQPNAIFYVFDQTGEVLSPDNMNRSLTHSSGFKGKEPGKLSVVEKVLKNGNHVDALGVMNPFGVDVVGAWGWSPELSLGFAYEQDLQTVLRVNSKKALWSIFALSLILIAMMIWLYQVHTRAKKSSQSMINELLKNKESGKEVVRLNKKLDEDRRKFYSMFENIPLLLHFQSRDYSVPFANKLFRERFGEYESRPCYKIMHDRETPCENCIPFRLFEDGESAVSVWDSPIDDRTYWTAMTPFTDLEGNSVVIEMAIDITEHVRLEEELKVSKEDAERSNSAKSEFLSRMSHELRTPLNAIIGFAQLLEVSRKDPLTESQKEDVLQIRKSGDHLLALINEILDLSKIESGQMIVELEAVNLSSSVDDTLVLLNPMAEQYGVSIENHVRTEKNFLIQVDKIRFKQVMLNLISNAIKYNNEGGKVEIIAEAVPNDTVRVCVKDDGKGISLENQSSLFRPFNRLDAEYSSVEGTGIGLTITKKLIELMKGTISFNSTPGRGSEFYIELPMSDCLHDMTPYEKDLVYEENEEKMINDKEKSVLYIEDNPQNMALVKHLMDERPEVEFLSAPQAKLGLELAAAHLPDLILMDINMPEMDGLQAFKILQKSEATRKIPVIALSANAMQKDIDIAMDLGFKAYITKPLDIRDFLKTIDEYLSVENIEEKAGVRDES